VKKKTVGAKKKKVFSATNIPNITIVMGIKLGGAKRKKAFSEALTLSITMETATIKAVGAKKKKVSWEALILRIMKEIVTIKAVGVKKRKVFFGGTYSQHYEGDGYDKSGWSEEREGFFGGSYTQHYGSDQKSDDDSCRTDSTNSGSSLSSSNSSYSNVGYSLADSSYDSSSSNGGYSPTDSDYDSSSSSGIGGLIAVAVFLAVVAFCGTAIWNGIKNGQSTINQSSVTRNQTPKMARVIMTKANLRPNPNDNRKPIMKIDYDGKLQLLSPNYTGRGWYHVRHISSGQEGWIHGNTIEFVY
jgi:hypothetical protein